MAAIRSGQRRVRRWWYVGMTVATAAVFTVFMVGSAGADNASGCDFAATGTTQSCVGPLTGSTFAGGDGNLLTNPTTFGTTDWQNVAGLNTGIDLPSGGGDNSFGQGTKEDDANVSVVTGSIPPSKSDLTRFYEASEFANGKNFLYLGWERTNNLGSANMDFEINQKTQPNLTTTGPKTLNRTAGDLLVTFDFTNGGGRPTLGLLTWVTSGSTSQCFSSNSLPCWGNHVTLNGANSEGAVNNLDAVTDPFQPGTNNVGALRFGEAAINLTDAGVFPPGTCEAFGSAFIKSRSSASFPAEVKDFIAPVPVNISNCGRIIIKKHTDPRGVDQVFSYTSNLPAKSDAGGVTCPGNSGGGIQADGSFCLNDAGNSGGGDSTGNTVDTGPILANTYTVTEGADPAGFSFEGLSCDSGSFTISGKTATISLAPGDKVTCTYVNQASGAILVTKTAKNHNLGSGQHPLAGATFNVDGGPSKVTDANGQACFDGLTIGSHTVNETAAPSGYAIDTASKSVSVTTAATCSSGTPASVSFTDSPLTDISANAMSEITGVTNSTIVCKDSGGNTVADSGALSDPANASATGLKPGVYTCTITIDP
jgi:Prealbumin-like fold domain